jgi:hypothetical protein
MILEWWSLKGILGCPWGFIYYLVIFTWLIREYHPSRHWILRGMHVRGYSWLQPWHLKPDKRNGRGFWILCAFWLVKHVRKTQALVLVEYCIPFLFVWANFGNFTWMICICRKMGYTLASPKYNGSRPMFGVTCGVIWTFDISKSTGESPCLKNARRQPMNRPSLSPNELARKLDEKWSEKILNATKFGSFAI